MTKQTELAGIERPVNKKIENAMQVLSDKKKAKTKSNNAHKDAEARVIDVMKDEKVDSYTSVDLGLTIEIDATEKAKLSAYHPPKTADETK